MIDKLRTLEETVLNMTKRYNVVATELANLKNKVKEIPEQERLIEELKDKIAKTSDALKNAHSQQKHLQEKLNALGRQSDLLHEENRLLTDENTELKTKNRLAIERAELIQTWLYNIDNAKNS